MIKKSTLCYRLRSDDLDLIKSKSVNFNSIEIQSVINFDDLMKAAGSTLGLCLFVEEQTDIKTFESILKKFSHIPIAVILKYRDFDFLMLSLKYKATKVFEGKLSEKDLDEFLIHVDLKSMGRNSILPVNEVIELFSKPAKIKSDQELEMRLQTYFPQFPGFKSFEILRFSKNQEASDVKFSLMDYNSIKKEIIKLEIPEMFIGFKATLAENDNISLVATPVLLEENSSSWLVLELENEFVEVILNELFYKFLENVLIYRLNKIKEQSLEVLAKTDEITGLFNQRKLSEDLESAVVKHEKEDETFSIMFIDVDHFKSVNDNYGHVVGSKLLQDIGEVLSLILRSSDHIYRYGGDEFVVIMPTVDIGTVHEIASRVLEKIKNKNFRINENEVYRLSVSIGIAEYPTDAKSAIEIIRFADEMMYMSKRSGRGKVFHLKEVNNVDVSSE